MKDGQGEKQEEPEYILKEGVDVLVCGIRVCPTTMTDELGKRLERIGFPMDKYFIKHPQK